MTANEFFHFSHVLAFAVVMAVDLPAFYAVRLATATGANADMKLMAARIARWANALSSAAVALLLPLGVAIAIEIGVYTLTDPAYLTATWIIGLGWFALIIVAEASGGGLGERLYTIEIWVRALIGLGNIYDAVVGFMGTGMIQTHWLATKVLLLGLILLASAWARAKLRPVRTALKALNPMSAIAGKFDEPTALAVTAALGRVRPAIHATWLMLLIAAWMGINKSF
ncbi:MAG: hypothetical protein SFV19_03580 [Rhodospirillaceae bacterium]|nr:hypothetical protein [Rhodospirillaceae bacterium]